MPRSPEETDAYLRLQSARRIHEATICRLEAAYINGSPEDVEMATSALLDTSQVIADRLRDLVFAQMYRDGIDPITRRSF
ncbi:hypothetical protein V1279_002946 [Bradyrhizobium sp. AZCC 1610]|uniref:hypothetical protein n=1 Tax=Bradyrhizobium sp. AZCC 1610 TaxID=3117020 RepID=UPI002FF1030C